MTVSNSAPQSHLSNDLLVRAMDDELSGSETLQVEMHLSACTVCRGRQAELRRVSDGFESFVNSLQVPADSETERRNLLNRMESVKPRDQVRGTVPILARFCWFMAAAATLALGLSYVPFSRILHSGKSVEVSKVSGAVGTPFEIDGETFQYLPYSNPDLPLGGSHVVQMQVPISSLAEAGVFVAPTASRMTMPDRAVLADVLLGMDGQPIGVHVLSADL